MLTDGVESRGNSILEAKRTRQTDRHEKGEFWEGLDSVQPSFDENKEEKRGIKKKKIMRGKKGDSGRESGTTAQQRLRGYVAKRDTQPRLWENSGKGRGKRGCRGNPARSNGRGGILLDGQRDARVSQEGMGTWDGGCKADWTKAKTIGLNSPNDSLDHERQIKQSEALKTVNCVRQRVEEVRSAAAQAAWWGRRKGSEREAGPAGSGG